MHKFKIICLFTLVQSFLFSSIVLAEPYGPTLNEVANKYAITRKFVHLNDILDKEIINIRLGMTKKEVENYVKNSKVYKLDSKNNSTYKFSTIESDFLSYSFDVLFSNNVVVMIKTYNVNNFEYEKNDLKVLKPLKATRTNECWIKQNFVDVNSFKNGYDFALMLELGIPQNEETECMGSDRANITIGRPGLLYPKHVQK